MYILWYICYIHASFDDLDFFDVHGSVWLSNRSCVLCRECALSEHLLTSLWCKKVFLFIKTSVTLRHIPRLRHMCRYHKHTHNLFKHKYPSTHMPHPHTYVYIYICIHTNTHTYKLTNTHTHTQSAVFKSYFLVELVQPLQEAMIPLVPLSARSFQLYQHQLDDLQKLQDCSPLNRIISHLPPKRTSNDLDVSHPKGDVAHMAGHQTRDWQVVDLNPE